MNEPAHKEDTYGTPIQNNRKNVVKKLEDVYGDIN